MRLRSLAAVLTIALAVAACAGDPDTGLADGDQTVEEAASSEAGDDAAADDSTDATGDGTDAAGDDAAAQPAADEDAAPEAVGPLWWTAETVADGTRFAAADLAGENVVLWLWAPWCSVCNREAPEVADALADLPDDVTVVGVAGRDDVGPMRDFVAEHDLGGMTHVVDADGSVWSSYGVSYQPAWVFIDGEGNASVAAGALGREGLFDAIDQVFRS